MLVLKIFIVCALKTQNVITQFYAPTYIDDCEISPTMVRRGSLESKDHYCSGELIFSDDFNSKNNEIDSKTWYHVITEVNPGNKEFNWYVNSRDNSYIKNGILFLRPTVDLRLYEKLQGYFQYWGLPYNPYFASDVIRSARINTYHSFAFKYGRVEVRAKLPTGDWLWPSIWLMPRDNIYGQWPRSGEIDLVESRGNRELVLSGTNIGIEQISSVLHYGLDTDSDAWKNTYFTKLASDWGTKFHNFSMVWEPEGFKFSVDGNLLSSVMAPDGGFWQLGKFRNDANNPWKGRPPSAPFDQYFYLIMNVAIGGNTFFPNRAENQGYGKPWDNLSPNADQEFRDAMKHWLPTWRFLESNGEDTAMQVDYVRVWAI